MCLQVSDRKVSAEEVQFTETSMSAYSVKLVGLFVTAVVGIYTIEDLWEKFGDLRMPYVS
jgi:dolichyl-phosphate-mannose--protein O-mannosyl transferase